MADIGIKRSSSKEVFQKYIQSWLDKDLTSFLSVLDEHISYTECYGACYGGISECEEWFRDWFKNPDNEVLAWSFTEAGSFYDDDKQTAFFIWRFQCRYDGKNSIFDGISLVRFAGDKIIEIQEFEQTAKKVYPYFRKD
jgi:ketosteroid isomerase-like protein